MKRGLFIGCGPKPFDKQHTDLIASLGGEWFAADLFCAGEGILQMDARDLRFDDNSLDYIYASHLLEHISYRQTIDTLKHWRAKLKEGGKAIINVPDLIWACQLVLGQEKSERWNTLNGDTGVLNILYGGQIHEGEYHKTGFTQDFLEWCLKEAGFKEIKVERKIENHEMMCLLAEATK